jgi:hypothetical protein
MPRNPALLGVVMALAPLACATTVNPGLANVPALGTSPIAGASVRDVIANGRDSCERGLGRGPLRDQLPPCPGVERPAIESTVANRVRQEPSPTAPSSNGVVVPRVEPYYLRWPCFSSRNEADRSTLAHLAPPYAASDRGLSGETCALPL